MSDHLMPNAENIGLHVLPYTLTLRR